MNKRILGDMRIFQTVFSDLNMKHEIVDGRYVYTYEGTDPYELEDAAFPKTIQLITAHTKEAVQEIEKAYGGCHNCYGKGYATQSSRAVARRMSWDTSGIKYCDCDRGKQLKAVIAKEAGDVL
ncbi:MULTISPECIES: hypothetical protein [Arthrobacter]|uniref:Uncharacterized protein n=1 Tax=Arthrobacter terricola TaxID=2547396 RepID=A0A4V2ZT45_9MICC|nr:MULTISPECIES: hypothetical protein [Arthrobacter]MBT8161443.1 hypothetical protein [Arthrobacter sp. GN70]TDF95614.1 hypothetical protein E1809_11345 [Arthrobacter terricola]